MCSFGATNLDPNRSSRSAFSASPRPFHMGLGAKNVSGTVLSIPSRRK